MSSVMNSYVASVLEETRRKNAGQAEFLQAVEEVFESIAPLIARDSRYQQQAILERVVEPKRAVMFHAPSAPTKAACASIPPST